VLTLSAKQDVPFSVALITKRDIPVQHRYRHGHLKQKQLWPSAAMLALKGRTVRINNNISGTLSPKSTN